MNLLGVRIDDLMRNAIDQRINDWITAGGWHQLATVNPEFLVTAVNDDMFRRALNECELNVRDGAGLRLAGLLTGQRVPPRYPGVDLIITICRLCQTRQKSILLMGGQPGVGESAAEKLRRRFTGLRINTLPVGDINYDSRHNLWHQPNDLVARINDLAPDVLLVGLGHPKQELWLNAHRSALPSVTIAMGVGGSFDFLSGRIRRAPRWLQNAGLEWLWRLIRQPWRYRRIINATAKFIYYVITHPHATV